MHKNSAFQCIEFDCSPRKVLIKNIPKISDIAEDAKVVKKKSYISLRVFNSNIAVLTTETQIETLL